MLISNTKYKIMSPATPATRCIQGREKPTGYCVDQFKGQCLPSKSDIFNITM